jgi:hypothetical protein
MGVEFEHEKDRMMEKESSSFSDRAGQLWMLECDESIKQFVLVLESFENLKIGCTEHRCLIGLGHMVKVNYTESLRPWEIRSQSDDCHLVRIV